jgi:hypothetical protein
MLGWEVGNRRETESRGRWGNRKTALNYALSHGRKWNYFPCFINEETEADIFQHYTTSI